jgi:hypothetical protein
MLRIADTFLLVLIISTFALPAGGLMIWIAWLIERRAFRLRTLMVFIAYVAFTITFYSWFFPGFVRR